jgi:hypothetical protein
MSTMRLKVPKFISSLAFPKFLGENRKLKDAELIEMSVLSSLVDSSTSMKVAINIYNAESDGNLLQTSQRIHQLMDDSSSSFVLNTIINRIDKEIMPNDDELLKNLAAIGNQEVSGSAASPEKIKASLRLLLLRKKLKLIQKLVDENELKVSSISRLPLSKVIDSILFGSASERIAGEIWPSLTNFFP